jgi:hypothetical protein
MSALHEAVRKGNLDAVQEALKGADVDLEDDEGDTAL